MRLALEYMAPFIWTSVGVMAAKLDGFGLKLVNQGSLHFSSKKNVQEWCEVQVPANQEDYCKCIQDFKVAFIVATRALSRGISNFELSLSSPRTN
jgi:hypothetical protein